MTFPTVRPHPRVATLAALLALGPAACSLDTGAPDEPKSLVGATSSSINVKTGAPATLSVFVLNNYGEPITGSNVTFTLTSGTGALSAATVATASSGLAQATFTPSKAGTSLVNASVPGLHAITFTVIATD